MEEVNRLLTRNRTTDIFSPTKSNNCWFYEDSDYFDCDMTQLNDLQKENIKEAKNTFWMHKYTDNILKDKIIDFAPDA